MGWVGLRGTYDADTAVGSISEQALANVRGLGTHGDGEDESNDGEDADHGDGCLKMFQRGVEVDEDVVMRGSLRIIAVMSLLDAGND